MFMGLSNFRPRQKCRGFFVRSPCVFHCFIRCDKKPGRFLQPCRALSLLPLFLYLFYGQILCLYFLPVTVNSANFRFVFIGSIDHTAVFASAQPDLCFCSVLGLIYCFALRDEIGVPPSQRKGWEVSNCDNDIHFYFKKARQPFGGRA